MGLQELVDLFSEMDDADTDEQRREVLTAADKLLPDARKENDLGALFAVGALLRASGLAEPADAGDPAYPELADDGE